MGERRQRSGRRTRDNAQIASERMEILFREAERAAREGATGLSERYVFLARSIGMRYNVRLPGRLKRRICQKCGAYLVPGRNLRVRLRRGTAVWTCLKCQTARRTKIALGKTGKGRGARNTTGDDERPAPPSP